MNTISSSEHKLKNRQVRLMIFTEQEIKNAVASVGHNKAPREDGITSEIFKSVVDILPGYITAIYNGCLRSGTFPTRWKKAKILPITKPGKESSEEVSKFRPISLLNIGGKVLEKVLINRINHHIFSKGFMNKNQYGFTPKKGTIDAVMEIKEIFKEGLAAGELIALVSLDVKALLMQRGGRDIERSESLWLPQKPLRTDKELFYPAHFVN